MSAPHRDTTPHTAAETPSPLDDRSLACAVGVLDLGRQGVQDVTVLTDEELIALDGVGTSQMAAVPFLEEHAPGLEARIPLARTAMRSLMTRRLVVSEVEASEFEERPLAEESLTDVTIEPRTTGALVLRRTSRILVWFEREVAEGTHRLYYYPHDEKMVLEEEVTGDGVHMFSVMPLTSVPARVLHLVNQMGIQGSDGAARTLPAAAIEKDPDLGPRIADTRALTVGTMLSRTEDVARRVIFHMTSTEVLAAQPSVDGEEVTLMPVSDRAVETLVEELFVDEPAGADA